MPTRSRAIRPGATRSTIRSCATRYLALRKDPAANAAMAGAFTQRNAAALKQRIGRNPTDGELYMAHFFGTGGAGQLINAAKDRPQANAAGMFPAAARANKSIFYDRQGNARSVAGVYSELNRRYQVARANVMPGVAPTAVAANTAAPSAARQTSPAPDTAGTTNAFAVAVRASRRRRRRTGVPLAVPKHRRESRRGRRRSSRNCGPRRPALRRRRPARAVFRRSPRRRWSSRPPPNRSICSGICGRTCAACSGAPAAPKPRLVPAPLTNRQSIQRFMVNGLLNIPPYAGTYPVPCCGTCSAPVEA